MVTDNNAGGFVATLSRVDLYKNFSGAPNGIILFPAAKTLLFHFSTIAAIFAGSTRGYLSLLGNSATAFTTLKSSGLSQTTPITGRNFRRGARTTPALGLGKVFAGAAS